MRSKCHLANFCYTLGVLENLTIEKLEFTGNNFNINNNILLMKMRSNNNYNNNNNNNKKR
ncbi:MAG TPA: hypothetical protein VH500_24380 [Nitrososphaeraceae archaeon]